MKIATWNVNSIRTRQQQVVQWLKDNAIDVLCLQETKVKDEDFPKEIFENLGYNVYVYGQKAYNGVAIFSQKPLTNVITGFSALLDSSLGANFDEQKRVISGTIDNIRIVNLYVPNGNSVGSDKYTYKLAWFQLLKEYLQQLKKDKFAEDIMLCGDFNIALENKDIYKPKIDDNHIMASPLERQALQEILALGFQDAFRKFNTDAGYFTWWDYRQGSFAKNKGWRIDHFYLTSNLYQKVSNCYIDILPRKLTQPSDHTPVILQL